jgi:hypothetical protein
MTATGNARRKPAVALRRVRALKLRQAGASYADIAQKLGLASEAAARTEVSRAMSSVVREAGDEVIDLERDRLDRIQAMAWKLAQDGDVRAIRELVRILERRAKLLGLDRTEKRDDEGMDDALSLLDRIDAGLKAQYAAGDLNPPTDD